MNGTLARNAIDGPSCSASIVLVATTGCDLDSHGAKQFTISTMKIRLSEGAESRTCPLFFSSENRCQSEPVHEKNHRFVPESGGF